MWLIAFSKINKLKRMKYFKPFGFGNLYQMCKVSSFEEEIVNTTSSKEEYNNEQIILFGDSFFEGNQNTVSFSTILSKQLQKGVYLSLREGKMLSKPSKQFERLNLDHRKKICLLEVAEMGAYYYGKENFVENIFDQKKETKLQRIINKTFTHDDLDHFTRNNTITFPLLELPANIKFLLFKEFNYNIAKYSLNPKMLFYRTYVRFIESEKEETVINDAVLFLEKEADILKEMYNTELILIIIPHKYSIYYNLIDDDFKYDDYITNFQNKLQEKGIKYINIYSKYKEYRETDDSKLLYFMSDTHYTPFGKQIVLDETVKYLSENNLLEEIDE